MPRGSTEGFSVAGRPGRQVVTLTIRPVGCTAAPPLQSHDQRHLFLAAQRFTLNGTAPAMARMGYCPTPLLFEAAALGTPVITDRWNGISHFFQPDEEILVCRSPREVLEVLRLMPEARRLALRQRARKRVRAQHTPDHRAETLESYVDEVARTRSGNRGRALCTTGRTGTDPQLRERPPGVHPEKVPAPAPATA